MFLQAALGTASYHVDDIRPFSDAEPDRCLSRVYGSTRLSCAEVIADERIANLEKHCVAIGLGDAVAADAI
jgi:hypothetical protein